MLRKISLHLLIICGIWSQGITWTFANEEIKESSDFKDRQKRVVSHLPGEDISLRISEAPHVVRIAEYGRTHCAGSVISLKVAITTASCVLLDQVGLYTVISSIARLGNGNVHNVTGIKTRLDHSSIHRTMDGVALLMVNPHFRYGAHCQPIALHVGPVLLGSFGKIYGFGYITGSDNHGTNNPRNLRSIEVPIISHQSCVHRYQPHVEISERNVCTYHPQRHSGHIDFGAGLVVDDRLAGVFLWSGLRDNIDPRYPDVFAYLTDSFYNNWIRNYLQNA